MQTRYIALAAALACVPLTQAGATPPAPAGQSAQASEPREVIALENGWRFRFGEADAESVTSAAFDDNRWEEVSVPHTWNRIGEYALERSDLTNNKQGIGWYRLTVQAPAAEHGMRQYLDFAAVGTIADVWVNGVHVGAHKGAFSRFRLDVTDAWKPGAQNLIAVRANNSKPTPGSSTADVIPLAGDFFVHGGLYRGVSLLQLPSVAIDPLDHGGPGVYVRTDNAVTDNGMPVNAASVHVTTRLRNSGDKARRITGRLVVRDASGASVANGSFDARVAPGTTSEVTELLEVGEPKLWDGTADPYLYTVTMDVMHKGRVLDSVTQSFGIRTFRVDPDKGFFLNGKYVKLKGVSRHQDTLGKGWALSREDHARDMAIIAEMGANSVRQAHYQHADEWSDEADKAGMVVWAELPYVGAPSLTGGKGSPELWANAEQQLRELIRQNYNHPSIMMWSIGNEVDSAKAFGAMKEDPSPIDLLRHMQEVAKAEDPTRPTIFADFSEDLDLFGERRQPMTGVADMVAYNRYPGWYYMPGPGAGQVLGGMMDKLHVKHPTIPMGISEYGAGSGLTQFSDDPTNGFISSVGRPQAEEYATYVHEMLWPAIASRDYLFGSWVWNMFDFASDLRNEGDSVDINTKGLVSMDRKVRKDAFYYYQAAWTDAPMVHFAGKRYRDRSYPVMDVKAFTNAPSARLTFNGQDLGKTDCINFSCTWKEVRLRPGANTAIVDAGTARDTATWNGTDPFANGVRIDAGSMSASVVDGLRYGSDAFANGGEPAPRFGGRIGPMSSGADTPVDARYPQLFDHWRSGSSFSYAIPVPDGSWKVTIRTLEPGETKIDPRVAELMRIPVKEYHPVRMSVSANGRVAIAPLDVGKSAGGIRKGLVRSFPVLVKGGVLKLEFAGVDGGTAAVAAIEISK
ncbi:MAG: beta-galactosidase [Novosphingobium sp.]|nr:beta-galactosidase [Novosphingobium sp.]